MTARADRASPPVLKGAFFLALITLFLMTSLSGTSVGQTASNIPDSKVAEASVTVFVADFTLDAEAEKHEGRKMLAPRQRVKDIVNRVGPTGEDDPAEKAKIIVNALSESIVKGLADQNVKASRLFRQPPPAGDGLFLEGEFLDFDQGDRMKKAIIGFGSGSPEMQVRMILTKIEGGATILLMDTAVDGKKNRMPGAAVTRNPYVAGAKFVLGKNASEKEVRKLGSEIAEKLYEYMVEQGLIARTESR